MDAFPAGSPTPSSSSRRVGLACVCLVLAAAALVRWPYLQRIPRFTDEVQLWRLAVDVLREGYRPLVFEDTGYNGALIIYLLAGLRWFTASLAAPRLLAWALGSVSVLLVYLLGRDLGGRRAGLIAASLFGVTATPVLVYSHVLHMTSLAVPLLCFGFWAVARAARDGSGPWLALAGVSLGLALQTHPLCAAFMPGLALWLWRQHRGRALLVGRWGAVALALSLLAYSPVLLYHLGFGTGPNGAPALSGVAEDLASHWAKGLRYREGLTNLLRSLADALGGKAHSLADPASRDPLVWLMLLLLAAGLWTAARRGRTLPVFLAASAVICLPLIMTGYQNTLLARYSGLTLPALHLGIGLGAADWPRTVQSALKSVGAGQVRMLGAGLVALLLTVAGGGLAGRLAGFYRAEDLARRSNDDLLRIAALAEGSGQPVVLDGSIRRTNGQGTGPSGVLQGIFTWRGVAVKKRSEPEELDAYLPAVDWPAQVIVADATLDVLDARPRLQPVTGGRVAPISDVGGWGLFRLEPH